MSGRDLVVNERGPTPRVTDLVLVALLLVFTAAALSMAELPVGQILGGLAVTVVTLAAVPLRRTRPLGALLVLAVPSALGYALQWPSQIMTWAVVAFALVRSPVRAGWALTAATLATGVVAGVGYGVTLGRVAEGIGYGISIAFQIGMYVVVGAVLGVISRAVRAREETGRLGEERARTAAALAAQRTVIADELGSGVLDGLRGLTARTAALDPAAPGGPTDVPDAIGRLERDAREVLTRMRRTLAALREPDDPATGPPVSHTPAGRRTAWLPTVRGVAAAAVFGVVAFLVGLLPLRPIGQPALDRSFALLDLPWGSPWAWASIAVQVLAVAWWRSAPVTAFVVATAASLVTGWLGASNAIVETSWMFLVYGVAVGVSPRRSGPVVALGSLAVLGAVLVFPAADLIRASAAGSLLSFLVVPFLWFAGVRRRAHRRHTDELRDQRHEAERAHELEAQRLRVARELHDVVAHHVSAIAVQAGAARITTDPDLRREALGHVADSGRRVAEALPELEGLTPDPGGVALTAGGLDDLVAPVRDAGVPVTCEVRGDPAGPQGDPELFAQRILTEALTNVVRHAGRSDTRVLMEHGPDLVRVEVVDAGPVAGHRAWDRGSGLGVIGMRERAEMLGGQVEAGPSDGGGWRVQALLPRAGVLREEDRPASISSSTTTRAVPDPA